MARFRSERTLVDRLAEVYNKIQKYSPTNAQDNYVLNVENLILREASNWLGEATPLEQAAFDVVFKLTEDKQRKTNWPLTNTDENSGS